MPDQLKGTRPRPRVALIGEFDRSDVEKLNALFPTMWVALDNASLEEMVDPRELDLAILGRDVGKSPSWLGDVHVISFSLGNILLPGPHYGDHLNLASKVSTEEFILPDLILPMHMLREAAMAGIDSIKGWSTLKINYGQETTSEEDKVAKEIFIDGALILDPYSGLPFASYFIRPQSKLGVAWLPNPIFKTLPWIELICVQLADIDRDAFPDFANWMKNETWMTGLEISLQAGIHELENERRQADDEFSKKIEQVSNQLRAATLEANRGIRQLITSQGDNLVNQVSIAFSNIGFQVTNVDDQREEENQKLEDLRIKDPNEDWEAIVEVRGYSRSGGTTADLARLTRFARHYEKDMGKPPSKMIYVVNGQIELPPYQRQPPLVSAPQDVEEFAVQGGLIIWALDLYKFIAQNIVEDFEVARKALMGANGRWPLA